MYAPWYIVASETAAEDGNVLHTLGIDVQLLIFQIVGFVILVWLMAKFVFPVMIRAVDERQKRIETGLKEAAEAHKALEDAESRVDDLLSDARKEAEALLSRSKEEAAEAILAAETKAKERADQIVKDARASLEVDVRKARDMLKKETIGLVAAATEQVIGEKVDAKKDNELIAKAIAKEQQ